MVGFQKSQYLPQNAILEMFATTTPRKGAQHISTRCNGLSSILMDKPLPQQQAVCNRFCRAATEVAVRSAAASGLQPREVLFLLLEFQASQSAPQQQAVCNLGNLTDAHQYILRRSPLRSSKQSATGPPNVRLDERVAVAVRSAPASSLQPCRKPRCEGLFLLSKASFHRNSDICFV